MKNVLPAKQFFFLKVLLYLNFIAATYCVYSIWNDYQTLKTCKSGIHLGGDKKILEMSTIHGSCNSSQIIGHMPGLVVMFFYISGFIFLMLGLWGLKKYGPKIIKNFQIISLFGCGVVILITPYVYHIWILDYFFYSR